jgi:Fe-S cluster assembly iron-binding protein IscA
LEIISNTFCNFAKLFKINLMIKISDSARDRLLQIMKNEEGEKKYVRVGVESGGCSG